MDVQVKSSEDLFHFAHDLSLLSSELITHFNAANKKMDEVSKQLGYKHVVTTIHPDNIYSINNILKCDFQYVDQKEFTRGVRNIYTKDI